MLDVSPVRSPSVVLVDPFEDERAMYAHALRSEGFLPFEFSDPGAAFSFATATYPQLVITDTVLGNSDGLEFTRRLRSDGRTQDLRIIVLSGLVSDRHSSSAAATAAGADLFLVKPCPPDVLVAIARRLAARSKDLRSQSAEQLLRAADVRHRASKTIEKSVEQIEYFRHRRDRRH
jgi:DNA-binding response OmpR family regulator